jgi:hypothetical protein
LITRIIFGDEYNTDVNILHIIKERNDIWIGYIWHSNCLLEQIIEGEGKRRNKMYAATG